MTPKTIKRRKSKVPPNVFWVPGDGYRPVFIDGGGRRYIKAAEAFYRIVMHTFEKLDRHEFSNAAERGIARLPSFGTFYPRGFNATVHTGNPVVKKAFDDLFIAIQKAIHQAHESGIERGKALLVQLAKGQLTAKQFNDAAIESE